MERLPENAREVLDNLVADLKTRESITSVGLFGSWSRGYPVWSSDVDLLVVENRDFDYEYVERVEVDDYFLDLNYVPEKWVQKLFPPEIDQKLYEVEVLYDSDGTLAKAKDFMRSIYSQPERVETRTANDLIEADTYLSRGISAYNKRDFQSAKVNAVIGLEAILRVFLEVNKLPFSNSWFIRALESSTERSGVRNLFDDYVDIASFSRFDKERADRMLDSFLAMWKGVMRLVEASSSMLGTLHVRVTNDLKYYSKESFLKGMATRTGSLINDDLFIEAAHYVLRTSISMLESYMWLVSVLEKRRFDYTVLFQRLKSSEISPYEVYQKAVETFGIEGISGPEAEESLRKAKEIILSLRRKRRELVANMPS